MRTDLRVMAWLLFLGQIILPIKAYASDPIPFIGNLERVDSKVGIAYGWALRRDDESRELEVQFFVDDSLGRNQPKFLGFKKANVARPDLLNAGFVSENHGFEFVIPRRYWNGKSHRLYVWATDPGDRTKRFSVPGSGLQFKIDPPKAPKRESVLRR